MRTRTPIRSAIAATALVACSILTPVGALASAVPARALHVPEKSSAAATTALSQVAQVRVLAAAAFAAEQQAAATLAAEQQAAAEAGYSSKTHSKKKPAKSSGNESARAQAILASLKARYPRYLAGVTVSFGNASGYQAVAYYTSGRIVISPTHRASLDRILGHEVWHIIDWRDNGRIDWREKVPPANASAYR
jgi:hypothetical protein